MIFAGRRWRVVSFDASQKVIEVVASAAGKAPRFSGQGGIKHDRIRQEMFSLLRSEDVPTYLDTTAKRLLGRDGTNSVALALQIAVLSRSEIRPTFIRGEVTELATRSCCT